MIPRAPITRNPAPCVAVLCALGVATAAPFLHASGPDHTVHPVETVGERGVPADVPRHGQHVDSGPPPAAPADTPADPGIAYPPRPSTAPGPDLEIRREPAGEAAAVHFNPDPGATAPGATVAEPPLFETNRVDLRSPLSAPLPPALLPSGPLVRPHLAPAAPADQTPAPPYAFDHQFSDLPPELALPREDVRENRYIPTGWHAPHHYPLAEAGEGYPAHTTPVPDRWRTPGFTPWRRYTAGDINESPYQQPVPELWHPYRQSVLKGDVPVIGQDIFFNLTAAADLVFEDRTFSVPSGVSPNTGGNSDFFGDSDSRILVGNFALDALLFKGETAFKPVEWAIRIRPVYNINRVRFREANAVSPNPGGPGAGNNGAPVDNSGVVNPGDIDDLLGGGSGNPAPVPTPGPLPNAGATRRNRDYLALQEAFYELHLHDFSTNYDFMAVKVGNQTFNSDFRGFIFNETNLGVRVFGNHSNNLYQFNLAYFDLREKDTNSELNTFDSRDQRVFIASLYRQDFLRLGYTTQLSLHANFDHGGTHYDTNGFIVRPAPIGAVQAHDVNAYYLGWAGDGHIGRLNISHAYYYVTGRDEFNGLAGRPVDISAHMAALELSYDQDWIRYKASVFYASGDSDPGDGRATGFDSIVDNVNFTGGPFSYFVRQGFNLAGTAVGLKQRFSLLPNLRTNKNQGQANFVNPGLLLFGVGADIDVTPKVRLFLSANQINFVTTEPLKAALVTNRIDTDIGLDLGIGAQWRPFLTDNVIVSLGYGVLLPGDGFRDIYRRTSPAVPGFTQGGSKVDDMLHSAVAAVTFTY